MRRALQLFLAAMVVFIASPLFAQLNVPEIPYDSAPNLLKMPDDLYLGETAGVATNSKGHLYVYTRTASATVTLGTNRVFQRSGGSRLFEFDQNGKYVREIGQGVYGMVFAHAVRVDPQDNVWIVDEADMVIKYDPDGKFLMAMGRKPEAINVPRPAPNPAATGAGIPGDNFNQPTDVTWDPQGNIFVSDGYGNSRIAKFDKNGRFIKSWGTRGTGPGQFNTPHSITADAKGNVYVADRENNRVQVFDNDGNFKTMYVNVGSPWAVCITPGAHQYLYSSNSNSIGGMENGEIYKMELDGTIVGKFGTAGHALKEFGSVHSIDCRNENELYVGDLTNWRVQKLTLHPGAQVSQK
jgi:DNA-binding beta-propeller fold protein YncE